MRSDRGGTGRRGRAEGPLAGRTATLLVAAAAVAAGLCAAVVVMPMLRPSEPPPPEAAPTPADDDDEAGIGEGSGPTEAEAEGAPSAPASPAEADGSDEPAEPAPPALDGIELIIADKPLGGWTFGNGPEFPGATGALELDETVPDARRPALRLDGDLTGGGNYVQAAVELPKKGVEAIGFLLKAPGAERLTVRLVDASDQCHQIKLKLRKSDTWQEVRFPVADFFRRMAEGSSLDMVAQYEKWGGAKDSRWHDPGKLLAILSGRGNFAGWEKGTLWVSAAVLVPAAESTSIRKTARLDDMLKEGEVDWRFSLGEEFPGAKGSLEAVRDASAGGGNVLVMRGDFTGGGGYVAAIKSLADIGAESLEAVRFRMRSKNVTSYTLQLVDGTGQCHQRKRVPFRNDGEWQDVVYDPAKIAGGAPPPGGEHWGGANDGKWHDAGRHIAILLTSGSNPKGKKSELAISEATADVVVKARVRPAAYREGFERAAALPGGWKARGKAAVSSRDAFKGGRALRLERTLERLRDETRATGSVFAAVPGTWRIEGASSADLHSPDNSYHGAVGIEALDAAGGVVERIPVGTFFGKADWKAFSEQVELPKGTAGARFAVELRKTYGVFSVDELSAAHLVSAERRVDRIVISTDRIGNLFMPGEKPVAHVSVETPKPLSTRERAVRYSVRDYWGVEQAEPAEAALERKGREKGRFVYAADLDLSASRMKVGTFYQLHVEVLCEGEPATEYSGIAFLPEAETRKHRPEDVPFTIRNWDSRITEYFYLADRIGLRQLGVWGGWSEKPPYKPHLPGLEHVKKLDAKWVTGAPGSSIERNGFGKYTEEALREGMRNFVREYGNERMMMICLGNEPHGKREKVKENVRAYRALYEAAKSVDPNVVIVGTSVEPNRDYFEEGYYRYLDMYDFHIYESHGDIRRTIREYRALMKEFDAEKPIISTELGLNSQGQTRLAVARSLVKKFASFFAEGGASASWFTIQYPDPDGKARGRFGDSHCVFDCKYNRFNPRLDAIAYYNMVNGICVKKFAGERQYPSGVEAYLFRDPDGRCLQVLWREGKRLDTFVPLPGVASVELVRIDGRRTKLRATDGGVALDASRDPVLLFYEQAQGELAPALGKPPLALASAPRAVRKGGETRFTVRGPGLEAGSLRVVAPPRWTASLEEKGAGAVECTATCPADTAASEGRFLVRLAGRTGEVAGEIVVAAPVEGAAR